MKQHGTIKRKEKEHHWKHSLQISCASSAPGLCRSGCWFRTKSVQLKSPSALFPLPLQAKFSITAPAPCPTGSLPGQSWPEGLSLLGFYPLRVAVWGGGSPSVLECSLCSYPKCDQRYPLPPSSSPPSIGVLLSNKEAPLPGMECIPLPSPPMSPSSEILNDSQLQTSEFLSAVFPKHALVFYSSGKFRFCFVF